MIVAFKNYSGVTWTENIWMRFQSENLHYQISLALCGHSKMSNKRYIV